MKTKIIYTRDSHGRYVNGTRLDTQIIVGALIIAFAVTCVAYGHRKASHVLIPAAQAASPTDCVTEGNETHCISPEAQAYMLELAKTTGITWYSDKDQEIIGLTEKYSKVYPQASKEVLKTVIQTSKDEKFDGIDYLLKLINCESKFKPWETNTKGNSPAFSVDRGLLMWNSFWQKKVSNDCAFDTSCSTKKAIEFIKAGRQSLWVCDGLIK